MAVPETRYARRSDGVNIGYQMLGSGPATRVAGGEAPGQQAEQDQDQVTARGVELGLDHGRGSGRDQRPGLKERGQACRPQ